ncbi:hypothetical protein BCR44DRAFT_197520 [Catenaria anguillulae PL171]|uniref:Uncharacterized protein n=1 Tax=Catenaria anguillulae PL171 TaxID=765915 RepID=A0A1Y2HQ98_9FUNG|nr:hypothetical protein BCR44DRAFT_197520 [Catenaria anguillulae PL171]
MEAVDVESRPPPSLRECWDGLIDGTERLDVVDFDSLIPAPWMRALVANGEKRVGLLCTGDCTTKCVDHGKAAIIIPWQKIKGIRILKHEAKRALVTMIIRQESADIGVCTRGSMPDSCSSVLQLRVRMTSLGGLDVSCLCLVHFIVVIHVHIYLLSFLCSPLS